MTKFSEPSVELAVRLLSEVGFEERFVGVKMSPKAGNKPCSIYSFEEALDFFETGALNRLKIWVSEVFGDKELSNEMGKEIEKSDSYMDTAKTVKQLMWQRLIQCKAIAGDINPTI